jgi:hypothetical protein
VCPSPQLEFEMGLSDRDSGTFSVIDLVRGWLLSFKWNAPLNTWLNLRCPTVESREDPYACIEVKVRLLWKQTAAMMLSAPETRYRTCSLYIKCQRWDRNHLPFFRCP